MLALILDPIIRPTIRRIRIDPIIFDRVEADEWRHAVDAATVTRPTR